MANHHDEVNDIMASIMGASEPDTVSWKPKKLKVAKQPVQQEQSMPEEYEYDDVVQYDQETVKKRKIPTLVIPVLVLIPLVGVVMWQMPKITSYLSPKSPFSEGIAQAMEIPLYYPTKLPENYKMELNSIAQPEENILVYAVTNDAGKKFTVSLQKQPEGINLDPMYAVMSDVRQIDTKFGSVRIGKSEEGQDIANVLTGQTWVIITSPSGTITDEELTVVINNLKV